MSEPNTTGNWRTQTPGCSPQPDPPAADLVICHCPMCQGRGCRPSPPDPPATDLLTTRGRVEAVPGFLEMHGLTETAKDLRTLLAVYDAQATRLAEVDGALFDLAEHDGPDSFARARAILDAAGAVGTGEARDEG